jgi:hypothetical protein
MISWRRRPAVLVTVVGLAAAALGDGLQAYDGPGPIISAILAAAVAAVRWRVVPALAAIISAVFIVGALVSPESIARLTNPSDALGFGLGVLQLLGFAVAAVAGTVAAAAPHVRRGASSASDAIRP